MMTRGKATPEGTARYAARTADKCATGHFRDVYGQAWSSIGMGTYLGAGNEATDSLVSEAVVSAVQGGINVLDSAANYRAERGEKSVGAGLERAFTDGSLKRDEVVVCSKGGYLPFGGPWFETKVVGQAGDVTLADVAGGSHCMHPDYLEYQLGRSLENLGLETIDVHYVHNAEAQSGKVDDETFWSRLEDAFRMLEGAVADGRIGAYGLATWNAFRVSEGQRGFMSLERAKMLARRVAGGPDHLKFIQLPLNLAMTEALRKPTQKVGNDVLPALRAIRTLGMRPVTSGSIGQGKLKELPDAVTKAIGADLADDAQRALQFTRSAPGVTAALIGMKTPRHVKANLDLCGHTPLPPSTIVRMFGK